MKNILPILFLGFFIVITYQHSVAQDNTATTPELGEGGAYERFLLINEKVQDKQGNVDLLFVGDSITERWEREGQEVWNEFFGDRKALNIGIGGDRTQHVLWRLDNGNIQGISPKVTVVMIGTNNSGLSRNTTSEMLDGVTAVVEKLHAELPETEILLLGIFPRGKEFNEQRGKITQVNQVLQKLDEKTRVQFLDIDHIFLQPDGTISEEIMPDALHLSEAGYRLWAEAMEPVISELLK